MTAEKPITEYRFFKQLIAKPYVEAVYLYGSRARGDNRPNSDFDLGVICHEATDGEWAELERIVRQNEELLVKVDVTRFDANTSQPFLSRIIKDRKLLYMRGYGSENISLHEKLDFIREWNQKMFGWANYLRGQIAGINNPDEQLLNKSMESFHNAFDCAWVLFRKCLRLHGMHTNTPLTSFREACIEGWLADRPVWELIVEDYYVTRHDTDSEDLATVRRVAYTRFPQYIEVLCNASGAIQELIQPFEYVQKS